MLEKYIASPDRYALLKSFARENRAHMTLAESILWEQIRGNRLGHKFLRQYPIYDYIVDFICRDEGLVIEVDGAYHAERDQLEDDVVRQHDIEEMGYHFLRFTNEDVLFNIDHVIRSIESYFE